MKKITSYKVLGTSSLVWAASAMIAGAVAAQDLPLKALPGDADRDHWLPEQVLSLIHI